MDAFFDDDFDEEFEGSLEDLTLVRRCHIVLSNLVNLGFHFEILFFDVQLVSLVQLVQYFGGLKWDQCDGLVYLRNIPFENDLDLF